MRNLIFTLLTAFLILGSAAAVNAQEWTKLAPNGIGFEVMMPGTPKLSTETKDSAEGPLTTNLYILSTEEALFLVGYVDYSPSFNFNVRSEINANRDNFLKGFQGSKLLAEKEISLTGSPGIEFTADLPNGRFVTSRIFIVGRRPYQLIAVTTKGADQTATLKFLDSFRAKKK